MASKNKVFGKVEWLDELAVATANYMNDVVPLKGSYITIKKFPDVARMTQDVDYYTDDYEKFLLLRENVIIPWCERTIKRESGLSYVEIPNYDKTLIRYQILNTNNKMVCGADVSLIGFRPETSIIEVSDTKVTVSSTEQIVADKFTVFCSRKRFKRLKDTYDLWVYLEFGTFNVEKVWKLIVASGFEPFKPFTTDDDVMHKLGRAMKGFDVVSPFTGNKIAKPEWSEMSQTILSFIDRLVMVAEETKNIDVIWRGKCGRK